MGALDLLRPSWWLANLTGQPDGVGGIRDPVEVARDQVDWILAHHYPQPLEEAPSPARRQKRRGGGKGRQPAQQRPAAVIRSEPGG